MPKIMKSQTRQSRLLQQCMKHLAQIASLNKLAKVVAKHQVVIFPRRPSFQTSFHLTNTMLLEDLLEKGGEVDSASTGSCFRLTLFHPLPGKASHGAAYLEVATFEIDITPMEGEEFTFSHSRHQCRRH